MVAVLHDCQHSYYQLLLMMPPLASSDTRLRRVTTSKSCQVTGFMVECMQIAWRRLVWLQSKKHLSWLMNGKSEQQEVGHMSRYTNTLSWLDDVVCEGNCAAAFALRTSQGRLHCATGQRDSLCRLGVHGTTRMHGTTRLTVW